MGSTVMYPVTAGGGTGSSLNYNLRQGMFVFGFFMDGEDGQQPVIMGVVGTNSYTAVMSRFLTWLFHSLEPLHNMVKE